jgi:hypothetical protein
MAVPNFDHIVVVMMENHDYSQIIGNSQAPYINSLASGGALLTNYDALAHPSEPNYFGLYAGSTFGITDDNHYSEPDPTLDTILQGAGKSFTGYVESGDTSYDHNPWESFPEGFSVEKDFSTFPSSSNFSSLPNVSFVIPNVNDDMHNGTIQQGDTWLQNNLSAYAQWAQNNNSLLVVTWDENDGTDDGNHVATILYGAHVTPGTTSATSYNHYDLLSMLLAANNLTGPRNAATAAPIDVFSTTTGGSLAGSVQLTSATEGATLAAGTKIASFTDSNSADTASGFTATITWGDGTSSAGTISGGNGAFTVSAGHTYADEGSEALSVAITRTADQTTITPTGTVAVAEADTLTPHPATLTATAGQALTNVAVASFTDSDTGNVAGDFTAAITWGDGTSSAGTVSGGNGTFTVTGSHTYAAAGTDPVAVTLSDNAPGTATATANSTANVGGGSGGGGRTISSHVTGPLTMAATDTPLTVTATGAVLSTGSSADGIDGPSGTPSTISNAGTISSAGGNGIRLTTTGTVTNSAGGSITGAIGGVFGAYEEAPVTITNAGSITGGHYGAYLGAGGSITNAAGASLSGGPYGVFVTGSAGTIANAGSIAGHSGYGLCFEAGGSVTNAVGGSVSANSEGVFFNGGAGTLTNSGIVSATGAAGVDIEGGGTVTNNSGASISGSSVGVFLTGGASTVSNAGTISGGSYAVDFAGSASNRLVVDPGAVFHGAVAGGGGALELAAGTGAISGIDNGSFNNFQALAVDGGASWTLNSANTVANVTDNGIVAVANSLDVSSAIDPSSTGTFQLDSGATLEVAAASGTQTQMSFLGSSKLVIDNTALFGTNVGSSSYAGPQLDDFISGDTIDLKNFAAAGVTLNYNSSSGVLQVANGSSQAASLKFQTSSLGSGTFHDTGDGAGGILITHG